MKFRKAVEKDYDEIYKMYVDVVDKMYSQDIKIWNKYYPFDEFEDDIKIGRLYVVEDEGVIVAGVALCDSSPLGSSKELSWENHDEKAIYIERLAVNINYQQRGIASHLITGAENVAKEKAVKYIRLAVVESNTPAMKMYTKNGFVRVDGVYEDKINETQTLIEYGYEKEVI